MDDERPNAFVDLVRNSACAAPTKRSFTTKKWQSTFDSVVDPTNADRDLYEGGLWLYQRLEDLRQVISATSGLPRDPDEFIIAFVGLANQQWRVAANKLMDALAGATQSGPVALLRMVDHKLNLPWNGAPTTIDAITSMVDALRYPLTSALSGELPGSTKKSDKEIAALIRLANLGSLYLTLETLWGEMLWNGSAVKAAEKADIVAPRNTDEWLANCVAFYRDSNRHQELIGRAVAYWRTKLSPMERYNVASTVPEVTAIGRSGRQKRILFRSQSTTTEQPPEAFLLRLVAQETYFESLLKLPLPKAGDLTLAEALNAWQAIAALGCFLHSTSRGPAVITKLPQLRQFAQTFERGCLIDYFCDAANLAVPKAQAAIELFTFSGTVRSDVWFSPLVRLHDGRCVVVNAVACWSNLLRTLEHWMQVGGLDLAKRGGPFEQEVRNSVADALAHGSLASSSGCCLSPTTFKFEEFEEEIDLVFWIGQVLAIGEVKCSLMPVEPLERFNVRKTLSAAAAQVARKATRVAAALPAFRQQSGIPSQTADVLPFVVTNLRYGSGMSFDGIPVIDLSALTRYLSHGDFVVVGSLSEHGKEIGHRIKFYEDPSGAAASLRSYLNSPPQHQLYKELLRQAPRAFPFPPPSGRPFYTLDYELDTVALDALVQSRGPGVGDSSHASSCSLR